MPNPSVTVLICKCGCGKPAPVYRGEQMNYIRGHAGAAVVRKKDRYSVDPETGCWVWNLYTSGGYGIVKIGDKVKKAHRHYYEMHKGSIPDGFVIDHLCKRKNCVNPDHLEAVPPSINTRRSSLAKISAETAAMIKALLKQGFLQTEIANTFGTSLSLVSAISLGDTWNDPETVPAGNA